MDSLSVALALLSAALHAAWNAAVKASTDPARTMTAQMILAALIVLPGLLWSGLPGAAALPWIVASSVLNLVTVTAMLEAYALAGFGLVYPLVRAIAVVLVVALATLLAAEPASPAGLLGMGLIITSLGFIAAANRGEARVEVRAFAWIALSAIAAAAYVMCDAVGVRRAGSPIAYGIVVSAANAALMVVWRGLAAEDLRALPGHLARAPPIAVASSLSYLLILWVWSRAPIAPATALRDTSAIFAILISVVWLREPMSRLRLAAVLLAALAIPFLRFA